jgi:hypothetical protein
VEVLVFELPFNNIGDESPIALKTADFFKKSSLVILRN